MFIDGRSGVDAEGSAVVDIGMWPSPVGDFTDQLWDAVVEYAVQDWNNDECEACGAYQAADDHSSQLGTDDSTSISRCSG